MEYIYIVLSICLVVIADIYIKRKFNIQDKEIELMKLILEVVDYVSRELSFKHDKISLIAKYAIEGIDFVEEVEKVTNIEEKRDLIIEYALQKCEENDIEMSNETYEIVKKITDFIMERFK